MAAGFPTLLVTARDRRNCWSGSFYRVPSTPVTDPSSRRSVNFPSTRSGRGSWSSEVEDDLDRGPDPSSVGRSPGSSRSALDGRQIEPAEPVWISQDVDLDDLSARDREAEHRQQAPVRTAHHDADSAVHQHHLTGRRKVRERRCLCYDRLSPTHEA